MKARHLIVVVMALVCVQGSVAVQAKDLFVFPNEAQAEIKPEQSKLLQGWKAEHTSESVKLVTITPNAFKAESLNLNTSGNGVTADRVKFQGTMGEKFSWTGKLKGSPARVEFSGRGDRIYGTFPQGKYVFDVRPLGGELHALIKRDPSKVKEHHDGYEAAVKKRKKNDKKKKQDNPKKEDAPEASDPRGDAVTTINVLVVYTSKVEDNHANVAEYIEEKLVNRTNNVFEDSNMQVRLSLAGSLATDYTGSGNIALDVNRLKGKGDGVMDNLHLERDARKADIVVLLIEDADAAGYAAEIKASEDEAFMVMDDEYDWYFTFAHEIGHLVGCWHNPEAHPQTNPYYDYGHGFRNSGAWRTIMAYNCSGGCNRIGLWSSPTLRFPAGPSGQPAGTPAQHDNRRVWLQRASSVAAFRN